MTACRTMYRNMGSHPATGPGEGFLWNPSSGTVINWVETDDDESSLYEWFRGPEAFDAKAISACLDAYGGNFYSYCDDLVNSTQQASGTWHGSLSDLLQALGSSIPPTWLRVESTSRDDDDTELCADPIKALLRPLPEARETIRRLNPNALDGDGNLKPFAAQYGDFSLAKGAAAGLGLTDNATSRILSRYAPFVLAPDGAFLNVPPLAGKPLAITQRAIRHILSKHVDAYQDDKDKGVAELMANLDGIVGKLARNVIAFQDRHEKNHYTFVLQETSARGNPITTVIDADMRSDSIQVDGIVSNHGNSHLWRSMADSVALGREFYVNERTGGWLASSRDLVRSGETELRAYCLASIDRLSNAYSTRSILPGCLDVDDATDELHSPNRNDLLKAYDEYVNAFGDSGYAELTGGWPLSVGEFEHSEEYTRIWREERSFGYLYDNAAKFEEIGEHDAGVESLADQMARVMGDDDGQEPGQPDGRDEI